MENMKRGVNIEDPSREMKVKQPNINIISFILLGSNTFQNTSMKLQIVECLTADSWMILTISFECLLTSKKYKGNKMEILFHQKNLLPMILGLTHLTVFSMFTFLKGHTKTKGLWYSILMSFIVHYVNILLQFQISWKN